MYPGVTSPSIWDVTKHMFEVVASGKQLRSFKYTSAYRLTHDWHKLYQAINCNDDRLHLINVFSEPILWVMAHFLFLLIYSPCPSTSWLLSTSVSFSPIVHSNLFLLLIPPMRLRSLSTSITVDIIATEKREVTVKLTSDAIDDNYSTKIVQLPAGALTRGVCLCVNRAEGRSICIESVFFVYSLQQHSIATICLVLLIINMFF